MSSKKKGQAPKPIKSTLIYNDKEIHEGSALHSAFTRLAGLGDRELAGSAMLLEMLVSAGATARKLTQIQSQLDRMEGRILELAKSGPARQPEPEPAKPAVKEAKKTAKKPSKAAKASVAQELSELEETVEQRQARMAKMEKDDKRKALALKKKQEELKAKKEKEAAEKPAEAVGKGEEKPEQKKKPRRRRKTTKKTTAEETPGTS